VPKDKSNLAAFVSVDGDASRKSYGTIRILELPSTGPVRGPSQIANDFATDSAIQQKLTQFNVSQNISKVYGNLLTLPVGDSLLYVQPLYTKKAGAETSGNFPVLNFVLVSFGDRLAIATTMSEAIAEVLRVDGEDRPSGGSDGPGAGPGGPVLDDEVVSLLQRADRQFEEAKQALSDGDLAAYQEHTVEAERLVSRALEVAQTTPAPSAAPSASPSPSAQAKP
jgi:uncharacterized membrane protein (UPF0182 family)